MPSNMYKTNKNFSIFFYFFLRETKVFKKIGDYALGNLHTLCDNSGK